VTSLQDDVFAMGMLLAFIVLAPDLAQCDSFYGIPDVHVPMVIARGTRPDLSAWAAGAGAAEAAVRQAYAQLAADCWQHHASCRPACEEVWQRLAGLLRSCRDGKLA
jgi:hypothetical protein